MQLFHAECKGPNALSAIDHTKLVITNNLHGTVRQTSKSTYQGLRQNRVNLILTHSNVLTAKAITRQIPISVYSVNIISTKNSIQRSIKRSMKIGINQFIQL